MNGTYRLQVKPILTTLRYRIILEKPDMNPSQIFYLLCFCPFLVLLLTLYFRLSG